MFIPFIQRFFLESGIYKPDENSATAVSTYTKRMILIVNNNNCGDFVFMALETLYMREVLRNKFKNQYNQDKSY